MNLIMRVFGHYEPLETPNLIMIVSLIIRCIMRLLAFQCTAGYAATQEEEAVHGPHPPQGGAGLHGAIAAAAQRGGERGGGGEAQRGKREAICIWPVSGECFGDEERP